MDLISNEQRSVIVAKHEARAAKKAAEPSGTVTPTEAVADVSAGDGDGAAADVKEPAAEPVEGKVEVQAEAATESEAKGADSEGEAAKAKIEPEGKRPGRRPSRAENRIRSLVDGKKELERQLIDTKSANTQLEARLTALEAGLKAQPAPQPQEDWLDGIMDSGDDSSDEVVKRVSALEAQNKQLRDHYAGQALDTAMKKAIDGYGNMPGYVDKDALSAGIYQAVIKANKERRQVTPGELSLAVTNVVEAETARFEPEVEKRLEARIAELEKATGDDAGTGGLGGGSSTAPDPTGSSEGRHKERYEGVDPSDPDFMNKVLTLRKRRRMSKKG